MKRKPLLIDFWRDNPFKELELAFPPVPSGNEIGKKIVAKALPIRQRLKKLTGNTTPEAVAEAKELKAQKHRLDELRKQLIKKADELRPYLPFDTLLSVQTPVPRVFVDAAARSAAAAEAWREITAGGGHCYLSDTDREDFAVDIRNHPLLDEGTD
jgi:hypothetical protein